MITGLKQETADFVLRFVFWYSSYMKIILLRDIARLGQRGEVKEVAEGYAMNVLIKKGDAVQATPGELAKWKSKQDAKTHQKELATNTFLQLIAAIRENPVVISGKKADAKGQLFASIKETDIADAIFASTKLSVDPKQILIASPIKAVGSHTVTIKQSEKKETIAVEVK